ncbi:SDR family oxidoreductase [Nocardia tengchongensis]|uniref:SDR family oxidoreductase n=1 Tax=Nocardia tengchongensis TaxID=2055889 RepID=UPI0036B076F4
MTSHGRVRGQERDRHGRCARHRRRGGRGTGESVLDTPRADSHRDDRRHRRATQPLPRFGEPQEVAAMVRFLITEATFSTGSEFVIDGGATTGQAGALEASGAEHR